MSMAHGAVIAGCRSKDLCVAVLQGEEEYFPGEFASLLATKG
jgi:hypothetical protein